MSAKFVKVIYHHGGDEVERDVNLAHVAYAEYSTTGVTSDGKFYFQCDEDVMVDLFGAGDVELGSLSLDEWKVARGHLAGHQAPRASLADQKAVFAGIIGKPVS